MDLKQKTIDLAKTATGDDEIFAAGDFQPKGMTWKRAAGAAAGSVAGGAISGGNTWGQTAGATAGMAIGTLASSDKGLPPVVVMAAAPKKLYLLATTHGQGMILAKELELLDTLDRDHLTITIKKRVSTRTIVIEDETTGHEYAMEGVKVGFHHMNDVLNVLEEEEEEAAAAAADTEEGLQPA